MLKGLLAALLGGLLLSGWSYVSWEVLGFHQPVLGSVAHENLVFEALNANLEDSAAYFLPRRPSTTDMGRAQKAEVLGRWKTQRKQGPGVFMFYRKQGVDPDDPTRYVRDLAINVLACLIVVVLLVTLQQGLPGPLGRIMLVMLAGVLTTMPHWMNLIWFNAPLEFAIVTSLDALIGWFLASIVIAQLVKPFRHVY